MEKKHNSQTFVPKQRNNNKLTSKEKKKQQLSVIQYLSISDFDRIAG